MLKLFANKKFQKHISGFAVILCSQAFGYHLAVGSYGWAIMSAVFAVVNYSIISEDF